MQGITCSICGRWFWDRPNRKYCSVACRREAERMVRFRKRKETYERFLMTLSPEERTWRETASPVDLWIGFDAVMKRKQK
jgi:hypothetical protein